LLQMERGQTSSVRHARASVPGRMEAVDDGYLQHCWKMMSPRAKAVTRSVRKKTPHTFLLTHLSVQWD